MDAEESTFDRRSFFGRSLVVVGAAAGLLTLAGCPGQSDDDDDDDGDDGDDD